MAEQNVRKDEETPEKDAKKVIGEKLYKGFLDIASFFPYTKELLYYSLPYSETKRIWIDGANVQYPMRKSVTPILGPFWGAKNFTDEEGARAGNRFTGQKFLQILVRENNMDTLQAAARFRGLPTKLDEYFQMTTKYYIGENGEMIGLIEGRNIKSSVEDELGNPMADFKFFELEGGDIEFLAHIQELGYAYVASRSNNPPTVG